MSLPEIKNCPNCNAPFECNPNNILECQCSTLALSVEQKRHLEAKFEDCLCFNCLKQFQEREI